MSMEEPMESHGIDALAGRVERLERECRLWRRAGAAVLIGSLALIGGVAATREPDELKVERLIIRSRDDDSKGILLSALDGPPSLVFFSEGQEKLVVTLSPEGSPTLSFDDAGKSGLMLGLSRNGAPILNFNDENQKRRISLGIFPQVGPMISVLDEKNKVLFQAP
jgi:hypothetical protein